MRLFVTQAEPMLVALPYIDFVGTPGAPRITVPKPVSHSGALDIKKLTVIIDQEQKYARHSGLGGS